MKNKTKLFFIIVLILAKTHAQSMIIDDIEYNITDNSENTVSITNYFGTSTTITIPETVTSGSNHYTVTSISRSAFKNKSLTHVSIPESITNIGQSAFQDNSLTSLDIPSSVTSIDRYAFYNNSLTSLNIPNSVTHIRFASFSFNLLTSITIHENVVKIEDFVFNNNDINTVNSLSSSPVFLPSNVLDNRNDIHLHIPPGTATAYFAANWSGFKSVTEDANILKTIRLSKSPLQLNVTSTTASVVLTTSVVNSITILSTTGSRVAKGLGNSVNISHLTCGLYIARIDTRKGILTQKFIK
ncbi:MAG: leucine-rich repeat domain-containing protein [Wenyingzhuangia sp.]|jgi:hypothetical protein